MKKKSSDQTLPFEGEGEDQTGPSESDGAVECLGRSFSSDAARREHFTNLLREKLKDPEFRKTPGFPLGTDEDILRMSNPPYYTACPNPFLSDFVRVYGKPYDPSEHYHRDPFAVDVSEGKADLLYQAHGYHTKVPHLAIVPSILHYTRPGDLVVDGFAGSGMTGVAAQWCGRAPADYRRRLEAEWQKAGRSRPQWGARRAVLNDLGPAASFIAAGYNLPFDVTAFGKAAQELLEDVESELGWMYETNHGRGKAKGRIEYTIWSEVFSCPHCGGAVVFVDDAVSPGTKKVRETFPCRHCRAQLDKDSLERSFDTLADPANGALWRRVRLKPVAIRYSIGKGKYEKKPDPGDLETLDRVAGLPLPPEVPTRAFPLDLMYHGSRLGPKGFTHVHHMFLPRAAQALAALWRHAVGHPNPDLRQSLLFFVEQAITTMTLQNRYQPQGFKQVNKFLPGVYYIPSHHCEVSPWYAIAARGKRIAKTFANTRWRPGDSAVSTGDAAALGLPPDSVDYVFTDPPFGSNIFYADLNYLIESWHGVVTDARQEAIIDEPKNKGLHEYHDLMRRCFSECWRILKPGRWMTVVFSNSSNAVWRAIQEAMGTAGFVVADVRTLDKQLGSYRQVTSSAVKQDLVISAYKPSRLTSELFALGESSENAVWTLVREHLSNAPPYVEQGGKIELVVERTAQMLLDRVIAFHVQRGLALPLSGPAFLSGLDQRFAERDGMYFLPEQAAEYDRRRAGRQVEQLTLFVTDEASAVQWVRQELKQKPRSFQDLGPVFRKAMHTWEKHEKLIELSDILKYNFLCYEGEGPVPNPVHSYLSTNFKDLRKREKSDKALREAGAGLWYVPDPEKEGDLEQLRERALLKEFEEYKDSTQKKLKVFRTEAVRVGFKAAYDARDWKTIVEVAEKLPESVLQEDEKLLMYYDVASMRSGD